LWTWEEDLLGECKTLLHDISLQSNVTIGGSGGLILMVVIQ